MKKKLGVRGRNNLQIVPLEQGLAQGPNTETTTPTVMGFKPTTFRTGAPTKIHIADTLHNRTFA